MTPDTIVRQYAEGLLITRIQSHSAVLAQSEVLVAARVAYRDGMWDVSYSEFSRASAVAPLSVDDLDAMASAAWRLGHAREALRVAELVYLRLVRTDVNSAAVKAVELGEAWLAHGHQQIGQGWFDRARGLDPTALDAVRRGRHAR